MATNFTEIKEVAKLPEKAQFAWGAIRAIIFLAGSIPAIFIWEENSKAQLETKISTLQYEKAAGERACGEEKLKMQKEMQRGIDSVRVEIYNTRNQQLDIKDKYLDSASMVVNAMIKENTKLLHHKKQ